MITLSPREQECVKFLQTYLRAYGVSPSYGEINLAMGFVSKSQVSRLIGSLVAKGAIKRGVGRARSIEPMATEDHHATDCVCSGCVQIRYLRSLQLVHALEVSPPNSVIFHLRGLKPVGLLTRVYWRCGFPRSEASSQPRVQAVQ